jgi:fructose/tagatose bisphosphate aldolase
MFHNIVARLMAKHYGIPVVLHSDHCAKKLLDWFDGMLEADEAYFKVSVIVFFYVFPPFFTQISSL